MCDRGNDRGEISIQRCVLIAGIVASFGKGTCCVHADREKRLIGGLDVATQLALTQAKQTQNEQSEERVERGFLFVVFAIRGRRQSNEERIDFGGGERTSARFQLAEHHFEIGSA